jgi:phosphoribosylformylglycinamidine cyclo-ligase
MERTAYEKLVRYDLMDPVKIYAQKAGLRTAAVLERYGYKEIRWSRGESCYLKKSGSRIFGDVIEALGTKNLILTEDPSWMDPGGFAVSAQDVVGAITNDMAPLGVQPMTIGMHLEVGSNEWFEQQENCRALFDGWAESCMAVGASWGCGETAVLSGLINPKSFSLSGFASGEVLWPKRLMTPFRIRAGDAIVLFVSNGIHANGLTLAREIAEENPDGYNAYCWGETYSQALLKPTILYSPIIQECLREGVPLKYGVNITGHGWAKLMRSPLPFVYVIETLPSIPNVLKFIQGWKKLSDKEMYRTFNMGAGFAVYVPKRYADEVIAIAKKFKVHAFVAGYVAASRSRRVHIKPKEIVFTKEDLKVR